MSLESLRQTVVELLASALCDLFPGTKIVDTSVNDIGFMCAIVLPQVIERDAFPLIEERMHAIVRQGSRVRVMEMVPSNAIDFLLHHKQPIRAMKLEMYQDSLVSLVQIGDFVDVCLIPPLEEISEVKAFKLQRVDVRKPFENEGLDEITCIYGTAFFDKMELKQFLKRLEVAQQSDHRVIGQEMQLYMQLENTGLWLWKPKGMRLKALIKDWEWKQLQSKELHWIGLPPMAPAKTEEESNIFIDGHLYELNVDTVDLCKEIFENEQKLPVRYINQKQIYIFSAYSQLEGLLKSRNAEMDEIHSFCAPQQLFEELISSLQIIKKAINLFPFEMEWVLYSQSPKGFKNRKAWKEAFELHQKALENEGIEYILDKNTPSLNGPKVEIRIADALGRKWSGPFITLNVPNLPEDSGSKATANINLSLLGTIERFIALIIENTGGNLPLWLSPEQVRIIPVSKEYFDDAMTIADMVQSAGARCSVNRQQGVLGEKVHQAMVERVPYVILVGEREKQRGMVSVRSRGKGNEERKIAIQAFIEQLREELKETEEEQNKRSFS